MGLLIVTGFGALFSGIVFLCAPHLLAWAWPKRRNQFWVDVDRGFLNYRIGTGFCLLAIGIFCLSSAYYVWFCLTY